MAGMVAAAPAVAAVASPVLAAAQAGTLGVGISGGGFLLPFMLGVINMLYFELGIVPTTAPVAGASAGAITAAVASGVVPMKAMLGTVKDVSTACRESDCTGTLGAYVDAASAKVLSSKSVKTANTQGNLYIAVSYPSPFLGGAPTQKLVNSYSSVKDLQSAIHASTYIPLIGGPGPTTDFRGNRAFDGSLVAEGQLPCPPGVTYCIRVGSMPKGASIGPAMVANILSADGDDQAAATQVLMSTAAKLPGAIVAAAAGYAAGGGPLAAVQDAADLKAMIQAVLQAGGVGANDQPDIWPGRRHPLPVSQFKWTSFMLAPPSKSERKALFDLGRAEALSWAQEMGFAQAKAKGPKMAAAAVGDDL